MDKLVSIVIPVYNVEKYLSDCVETIIKQTYKDIEIILVDDGSTDNSGEICDSFAEQDKRIKVIHKKNGGLSDARNKGIDIAVGEYIVFVDSDDFLQLDAIEYMVYISERMNADIVCVKNIRCESDDSYNSVIINNIGLHRIAMFTGIKKMKEFLVGHHINTTAWAKLYKTSLFEEIRFPFGKYHEDVFTTYLLIDKANKVVTSDFIGYIYRKNDNSITGKSFTPKRLDSIEGKIQQSLFIKEKYPNLNKQANAGIIYACNENLALMAKANYFDSKILLKLKKLYKKYWIDYIRLNVSLMGKCMAILAVINIRLAFRVCRRAIR